MKFGLREVIFVGLLMLIPLGAWWFVFRPQNAENTRMRTEIEIRQAKLTELNKAMGKIGDLKAQIARLEEGVQYFQSKLPNEKEIDKILQDIWQLAESNDLHTASIRTLTRSKGNASYLPAGSSQGEQPIEIHLTGDFMGFYSFLLALENQARIMRIRLMDVEIDKSGPSGLVDAQFEMSIFFEQDGAEDKSWLDNPQT
jgi:Tfp pilus assembly protein PilO